MIKEIAVGSPSVQRLRVAYVVTLLELGGAQKTVLSLLKDIDRERFEPSLVCGRGGILDGEAVSLGVPVFFIPSLVRPVRPWKDIVALWRLVGHFRRLRPDLVHTHSSKAGVLGRVAAWLAGVPVLVHTVHGFGHTPRQSPTARRAFITLERVLARITSVLIFVSNDNRRQAEELSIGRPDQHRIIRAAVELRGHLSLSHTTDSPEGWDWNEKDPVITTVGPFKPQKNLLDFIEAAARVAGDHPSARFLMIGDGEGRAAIEKEIARSGLEGRVVLAGWRRDVPRLLARTDVFCMTSLWEGLPMALVEAMAAGVPCVVNDVDGCRDLVQDGINGFLTPPKNPAATADRLLRLLTDKDLAQRLGARARASVGEEFDIRTMVRQQEDLYVSLIRRGKIIIGK